MVDEQYNPYQRAIDKAEANKQIVEEYLMGPESVQVVEAIGDILLSWQVLAMYVIFLVYRIVGKMNWIAKVSAAALAKIEEAERG